MARMNNAPVKSFHLSSVPRIVIGTIFIATAPFGWQNAVGQSDGQSGPALIQPASQPAPQSSPFAQFAAFDDENRQQINYQQVDEFIAALSTKSRGRLNFQYATIREAGLDYLGGFINAMSRQDVTKLNRQEQLAYWLNLRNLLIIRAIAEESPIRSLTNARGTVSAPGPLWTKTGVTVNGVDLSIDLIEREIILANWPAENTLYGLYQGVQGGPSFPQSSFRGDRVNDQLTELGANYVNARGALTFKDGVVTVPAPYDWYRNVLFDNSDAAILSHLNKLANDKTRSKLSAATSLSVSKMRYRLDEQSVRTAPSGPLSGSLGDGGSAPSGS